jgi:MFS family permease
MKTSSIATFDANLRSNIRNLYFDIFWYGVLAGSTIAFLSVYATRIGATSLQLGLLTAGPAVANLIISLPTGRWLEQHSMIRVTFLSSIAFRAGYLPLVLLPWLLAAPGQVWTLELIVLLMALPGTILAISFNAMFAEVVPPDRRGYVVGWRNALVSISTVATSLLCGWLLDRIAFPLNYQIVFGLGALGAALSSYHLGRIRSSQTPAQPAAHPPSRAQSSKAWLRFDLLRGPFRSLLAVYLLFYTFQYVPIPLFPLAMVRELRLSDGAISLGTALFNACVLLGSLRLGRMSERLGHRRVLMFGALLYCAYPLFIGLARNATLFWVASMTGGAAWALAGGALVNRLMERVPRDDLPAHMALHNIVLNLGMLGGSLIGPAFGNVLGLRHALLLSAGLRLMAGILLGLWG